MAEYTCFRCGLNIRSDEPESHVCGETATAVTELEVMLTRPTPNSGGYIAGRPELEPDLISSAESEGLPSILREYHYSFLRICAYTVVGTAALIIAFVFLFLAS